VWGTHNSQPRTQRLAGVVLHSLCDRRHAALHVCPLFVRRSALAHSLTQICVVRVPAGRSAECVTRARNRDQTAPPPPLTVPATPVPGDPHAAAARRPVSCPQPALCVVPATSAAPATPASAAASAAGRSATCTLSPADVSSVIAGARCRHTAVLAPGIVAGAVTPHQLPPSHQAMPAGGVDAPALAAAGLCALPRHGADHERPLVHPYTGTCCVDAELTQAFLPAFAVPAEVCAAGAHPSPIIPTALSSLARPPRRQ